MEENEIKVDEKRSSVKIGINAKGLYSGEVKAYAESCAGAMAQAVVQADVLDSLIKAKNLVGVMKDGE